MRRTIATVAILICVICIAVLYQRYEAKRQHLRLEQHAAELMWNEFVKQYQRDLPPGTSRADAKNYFDGQKALYVDSERGIDVKLGETPGDGFVCDRWTAYASLEFIGSDGQPKDQDTLAKISLKNIGHCL